MGQKVLVIGNGGREHAIAWKLAQSPRIDKLYVAPGNGGTRQVAENIPIDSEDIEGLLEFAVDRKIAMTVVGDENSLAAGIVDAFQTRGLRIFGPTRKAAEIESSKAYSKNFMMVSRVPTGKYEKFSDHDEALMFLDKRNPPWVIKADGLARGKGVYICHSMEEAERALWDVMVNMKYDDAGLRVIIEDFLEGPELSLHALSDGITSVLLPPAQDHKLIGEGDTGKNTGGMGSIVPVPWVTPTVLKDLDRWIVRPTLDSLRSRGREFRGLLFPGLKMTSDGPRVLEFNARFGDPETQSYMRLLKTDLLDVLDACVDGTLSNLKLEWHPGFAVCVVLASGGYPDDYAKGFPIGGVTEAESQSGIVVFHAGTIFDGELKTSGGRVLGVTATGETLSEALNRTYCAIQLIHFEGMQYRRDIGAKSL